MAIPKTPKPLVSCVSPVSKVAGRAVATGCGAGVLAGDTVGSTVGVSVGSSALVGATVGSYIMLRRDWQYDSEIS